MTPPALHVPMWTCAASSLPAHSVPFLLTPSRASFCPSVKPSLVAGQALCNFCPFPPLSHGSFLRIVQGLLTMLSPQRSLPCPSYLKPNSRPAAVSPLTLPPRTLSTKHCPNLGIDWLSYLMPFSATRVSPSCW